MTAGGTIPDTKLAGKATELVDASSTSVIGRPTTTELPFRRRVGVPAYYYGMPASAWLDRLHRGRPSAQTAAPGHDPWAAGPVCGEAGSPK
jgi:hypothetical protein